MTYVDPGTDRRILTRQAYATDECYAVRMRTHELYSRPKIDFTRWVVERLAWRGDERVLDVGSGPGTYFDLVQRRIPRGVLIAGDLSLGMVQQARKQVRAPGGVLDLDVQHLPFADHSFDVVLANHMLYHVPNVELALAELHRVLRREGCLIAATNSTHTMPELDTLARRACTLLGFPRHEFRNGTDRFALENGSLLLARHFRAVARYDIPSAFVFPSVEPVLAYLESTRALRAPQLPIGVDWDEFMDVMEKQVRRLIQHMGELRVEKLAGALVATDAGGFARDYLHGLNGHH